MSGRLPTAAITYTLSLSIHPNAAGKSTQIGLLTIMAQCWLFVPAENATNLLTRLDDIEKIPQRNGVFCDDSRLRFFRIAPF